MAIQLILHQLLVDPDKAESITPGGIVIPEPTVERERKAVEYGTVVQVGPTAYKDYGRENDAVKVGDRVCMIRYSGKEVKDTDGHKYIIINDIDILCIIK